MTAELSASDDQQQFYSNLTKAINQAIAGIYDVQIALIQFPSQGDFIWNYRNANLIFNQGTFDYISARVSPGEFDSTVQLSPAGGFPNAYVQVISKIAYTTSSADSIAINKTLSNASAQAQTIVSDYQTTFGQITQPQMQLAQQTCGSFSILTLLDYVVTFVLGYQWSGHQRVGQPPLTYEEMAAAQNLTELLPAMPSSGNQVVSDVSIYIKMMSSIVTLQSHIQLGNWMVSQLLGNTSDPTDANGGMKTVDPFTGAISVTDQVGYRVRTTIGDILNALNNKQHILKVEVPLTPPANDAIETVAPLAMPAFDGSFHLTAQTLLASGQGQSITIEYPGYILVSMAPEAWQQANNTGWYAASPILEALANGNQDVTGFKFVASPEYNLTPLADGGNFGQIANLLISNYPTITVNYKDVNLPVLESVMPEGSGGRLVLFDLNVGGAPLPDYVSTYLRNDTNKTLSVAFSPRDVPIPPLQQTAFVIGGAFNFPTPANMSKSLAAATPTIVTKLLTQLRQRTAIFNIEECANKNRMLSTP